MVSWIDVLSLSQDWDFVMTKNLILATWWGVQQNKKQTNTATEITKIQYLLSFHLWAWGNETYYQRIYLIFKDFNQKYILIALFFEMVFVLYGIYSFFFSCAKSNRKYFVNCFKINVNIMIKNCYYKWKIRPLAKDYFFNMQCGNSAFF